MKRNFTVEIDVTAEDIRDGQTGNCHSCPIALAMRRVLKSVMGDVAFEARALNHELMVYPSEGYFNYSVATPPHFNRFMRAFDSRGNPSLVRAKVTFTGFRKLGA